MTTTYEVPETEIRSFIAQMRRKGCRIVSAPVRGGYVVTVSPVR